MVSILALNPHPAAQAAAASHSASAAPAAATTRLVQDTGAVESNAHTSLTAEFPAPTTAGDLLVLSASVNTGTSNQITAVTDSAGGSWHRAGAYAIRGTDSDGEIWYSANSAPVSQITVHMAAAVLAAVSVQGFSGMATADPLDAAAGASALSTAPASGPASPSGPDVAVGFIAGHGVSQALHVTATGYATQAQRTSGTLRTVSVVSGYQVLTGTASQNFTGSLGTAAAWAAGVALFKVAPPDDFAVSASPASVPLSAGHLATVTVSTSVTSGLAQPVALSAAGLPNGITANFQPPTITAGQQSVLTLWASVSTAPGTYHLVIAADGPSASHTAQVTAIVTAPAAIRAAVYYPWFPQAWRQQGQNPFTNYVPARGYYSDDVATLTSQIAEMQYGGITLGLASWFGPGTATDQNWPVLLQAARGTSFAWGVYYEPGNDDQAPQQIVDDVRYIEATYGGPGSALADLPGKGLPVFVYNADDTTTSDGCQSVTRWDNAKQLLEQEYGESVYVNLKVFPGYKTCPGDSGIDGWHQYAPTSAVQDFSKAPGDGSYTISPGFWKSGNAYGTGQFLARDLTRWRGNVASMNASGARWQLITTYNEWGEGSAIEGSVGCRASAPAGTLCGWTGSGNISAFITALHNAPPP